MIARTVGSALLVVVIGSWSVHARQTVTVEGVVTDTSGGVLPGARVSARAGGRAVTEVVTGSDGRYRIQLAGGRTFELSASLDGFSAQVTDVTPAAATVLNFELAIAPLADTVVVTPTGTERSRALTAESVTVFTSDDLAELGSHSLADVVTWVPGLDVSATGREGAQASLFSRGGESDYNHVLIDGVRVNLNGGQFDFSRVSAAEIDRVEVVRGAQSARYGSDAIGSVIHIFTKRGAPTDRPHVSGSVEGGSFGTFRGDARVRGGALATLDYQLGVTRRSTDGAFGDVLPERDEYDQTTVDGNVGVRLSDWAGLRSGARYSDGKGRVVGAIDYAPGDTGQFSDTEDLSWYLNFDGMLTSSITHRADVNIFRFDGFQQDTVADTFPTLYTVLEGTPGALFPESPRLVRTVEESEFVALVANPTALLPREFLASTPFGVFFGDFPFVFEQSFRRSDIDYQLDVTWMNDHVFSAGYEYLEEKDPTQELFSIDNHAFFAQQQFTMSEWFLTVGARVDDNSRFGTEVSPKLSAGGFPVPFRSGPVSSVKVFITFGRGLKNPTFGELFPSAFADGNPSLEPERALTFDAGAELTFDDQRWMGRVTVFNNRYEDQVAFLSSNPSFVPDGIPDYLNVAGSDANGVELELGLQRPVGGVTARASYALVDTKVVATTSTSEQFRPGQPLLRRPKHTGVFHVSYTRGPGSLHFDVRAVSERHDAAFAGLFTPSFQPVDITVNPGYVLMNLGGQVRVHDTATVFLQIENIGDERYSTALGYPGMPRAVYIGTRFNLGP